MAHNSNASADYQDPSRQSIQSSVPLMRSSSDSSRTVSPRDSPVSKKPARGFFNRMLGRTNAGPGHRSDAFVSVVPASTIVRQASPAPESRRNSEDKNPADESPTREASPLTINTLSTTERTERVKRNRKIVQLLGHEVSGLDAVGATEGAEEGPWSTTPSEIKQYRRHSSPISPSFVRETILSPRVLRRNFFANATTSRNANDSPPSPSSDDSDGPMASGWSIVTPPRRMLARDTPITLPEPPLSAPPGTHSPTSTYRLDDPPLSSPPFITSSNSTRHTRRVDSIASISTVQTDEDLPNDEYGHPSADEERARKRATLSKLHRFLGSRIPPELVLNIPQQGTSESMGRFNSKGHSSNVSEDSNTPTTVRTRGPAPPSSWSPAVDPMTAPVIVSRMGSSRKKNAEELLREPSLNPVAYMSDGELDSRSPTKSKLTEAQRAHIVRKQKKIQKMLGSVPAGFIKGQSDYMISGEYDGSEGGYGFSPNALQREPGRSQQYILYRSSINSLTELVNTNDQGQLQDLLAYIKSEDNDAIDGGSSLKRTNSPRSHASSSEKASTSTSTAYSAQTEIPSTSHDSNTSPVPPSPTESLPPPPAQPTSPDSQSFQHRRKRAAKLSSFFGVEYRELFTEVLDVIESEVRQDSMRGSLSPEETQELLVKLRKLKRA